MPGEPIFLYKFGNFSSVDLGDLIKTLEKKLSYFEIVCEKSFYDTNFLNIVRGLRTGVTSLVAVSRKWKYFGSSTSAQVNSIWEPR